MSPGREFSEPCLEHKDTLREQDIYGPKRPHFPFKPEPATILEENNGVLRNMNNREDYLILSYCRFPELANLLG